MGSTIAVDLRSAGVETMRATALRAWPNDVTSKTKIQGKQAFDAQAFLYSNGVARRIVEYESKAPVFTQGDPATSVLYIQKGSVKLTVVNESGKEAVVAILGPGDFFGEGCLTGQSQRTNSAETITRCTILVVEKPEMARSLHAEQALSERFIEYMLFRNIRIEEDLIDQLFNSTEKRLARALLLLANYGKQDDPEKMVPAMSQEVLAEMIGTTRSRVSCFMNKFRDLGYIKYGGKLRGLRIDKSLLSVVLND